MIDFEKMLTLLSDWDVQFVIIGGLAIFARDSFVLIVIHRNFKLHHYPYFPPC